MVKVLTISDLFAVFFVILLAMVSIKCVGVHLVDWREKNSSIPNWLNSV